ncbi:nuclear transport factor 2 family protein [Catelliglobosispora koreensis]|uniref:nuclear transport factor 2 family protein n=1 Tax=Catelliglobosispora koreensis TaxID=129052 RepID=UPI00039DFACC|nr:nuclear transport factor 2 family protein [Catelliglobosispora koreensis]
MLGLGHQIFTPSIALAAISAEFPSGLTYTVGALIAEQDRVAAEVGSTGVHLNGKPYANHHHFLFTVRDGQIVVANEYMDTKHLHDFVI